MNDNLIEMQRRIDTLSRMLQEDQDEISRLRAEVRLLRLAVQHANDHADAAIEEIERLRARRQP